MASSTHNIQEFVRPLQDAEYDRSAKVLMDGIAQIPQISQQLLSAIYDLDVFASPLAKGGWTTPQLVMFIAEFRRNMNYVARLIEKEAPGIAESGAYVANRVFPAKALHGTTRELIDSGVDPTDAKAFGVFMDIFKYMSLDYSSPDPAEYGKKYTQAQAFRDKLKNLPDYTTKAVVKQIDDGIKKGWNPKKVASYLRKVSKEIPKAQAYRLTRTLQLQAYRDATARAEQINGDLVKRKIRIAALDGRTCPTCIALHGSEVPMGQPIKDHWNGRCDAIYSGPNGELPEFMQAMSEPGKRKFTQFERGPNWFNTLDPSQQKKILGPGKFEWFKKGHSLTELIGYTKDNLFGVMPIVKPLWELEGFSGNADRLRALRAQKAAAAKMSAQRVAGPSKFTTFDDNMHQWIINNDYDVDINKDKGYFDSEWVTFPDGTEYLRKPNSPHDDHYFTIDTRTLSEREGATYEMCQELGVDLCPECHYIPDDDASYMLKVPGTPRAMSYDGPKFPEERGQALLTDMVLGNTDRHDNNWMISPDGHTILIDHGLTFGELTDLDKASRVWGNNFGVSWKEIADVPTGTKQNVKDMLDAVRDYDAGGLTDDTPQFLKTLDPVITPAEVYALEHRLDEVYTNFDYIFREVGP